MKFNETLALDILDFGKAMIASHDIDPLYDVLRELYKMLGLDEEGRLWFTALYLAYYNLPSAFVAWRMLPRPCSLLVATRALDLPIATERRGLRVPGNLLAHTDSILMKTGSSIHEWITAGWGNDPERNFLLFWDRSQTIYQNGRWAAFKWLDLLKNVHGYPVSAPDMRMEFCTGPKEGLQILFTVSTERAAELDSYGIYLRNWLAGHGLALDWEQLETILCNFKSLYRGKYYVGHDIDELQERIEHPQLDTEGKALLYLARQRALPSKYLGELNGWSGIQKHLLKVYAESRWIYTRL